MKKKQIKSKDQQKRKTEISFMRKKNPTPRTN